MALSPQSLQRSKSLHEQAYHALRTAILSGELTPGDRLVETQLAQGLQVSRTPLREALRQLQQEGLVTAEPNGGLRVSTVSVDDAAHLYDCRLALEQLAVAEACQHITKAQLKRLSQYVNRAETRQQTTHANTHANSVQWLDLDYQFHHLIAESSGNRRLVSLLETVFDAMLLLRIQTLRHNPGVLDIRLEHRQIYEAIAQRDSISAVEAIKTHLMASKDRVVQEIQRQV